MSITLVTLRMRYADGREEKKSFHEVEKAWQTYWTARRRRAIKDRPISGEYRLDVAGEPNYSGNFAEVVGRWMAV